MKRSWNGETLERERQDRQPGERWHLKSFVQGALLAVALITTISSIVGLILLILLRG